MFTFLRFFCCLAACLGLPFLSFAWTVVVDAGHGGRDPGALSPDGQVYEKNMTLLFAHDLAQALAAFDQIHVVMTREDDRFLSLSEREALVRDLSPDLFVSVHMDQGDETFYRGFTLYTQSLASAKKLLMQPQAVSQELRLPDAVQRDSFLSESLMEWVTVRAVSTSKKLAAQVIADLDGLVIWHNKRVVPRDLFVLHRSVPNMLLEMGFISNEDDLHAMQNADFRKKVASAFAQSVASFLFAM